ncbi:MAG: hypothetical protein KAT28_05270 [Candidatus Aenigmarchaeota archaeon]|nr:hypothetical protein [Candidatus Aenigmarchaeota archaeon]
MLKGIRDYIKDSFYNREKKKLDFIIGNMDEKMAKYYLKDCFGIGFNPIGVEVYKLIGENYNLDDLDGKWAVDVLGVIKNSYKSSPLSELEQGLENPNYFHYLACCVLIDHVVLEELSHTAGYIHSTEEEDSFGAEVFSKLALESHEPSAKDYN